MGAHQFADGFFENLTNPKEVERLAREAREAAAKAKLASLSAEEAKQMKEVSQASDYAKAMELLRKEEDLINRFRSEVTSKEKALEKAIHERQYLLYDYNNKCSSVKIPMKPHQTVAYNQLLNCLKEKRSFAHCQNEARRFVAEAAK